MIYGIRCESYIIPPISGIPIPGGIPPIPPIPGGIPPPSAPGGGPADFATVMQDAMAQAMQDVPDVPDAPSEGGGV